MRPISNEFILGTLIGYFLQNYFIIFILGLVSGILVVEKYGAISNIFKWSIKSTNENVREIFSSYIKRAPLIIEKNTLEKDECENKLENKLD